MLYVASDHRGYGLKEKIKEFLNTAKIKYEDVGAFKYDKDDDLPIFALTVAKLVSKNHTKDRGIIICGSGVGGSIIGNKFKKARAALCLTVNVAKESREHHDSNILCLAAELTDSSSA
ncbi:MAG: RpiB/LacA/LacB family sugar-phosphate isomerase [Candidatus Paceibacterota bacterium]|jgi:ribose 5-phosphate isomerase B